MSKLSGQLIAALQAVQGGTGGSATELFGDITAACAPDAASPASQASASSDAPVRASYLERIAVDTRGQVRVVPVAKVLYITASGPYAELHTAERTHLIRERVQVLEQRLDPELFFRVYRSAIVRCDLIEGLTRNASGDYTVQLKGGATFKVSRRTFKVSRSRSDELERRMGLGK